MREIKIEGFDEVQEMLKEYREGGALELKQYRAIGTVEEIKEILQIISEGQDDVEESGISTGLLHALLEYAEYAKIGTVEECREAMEKQRGKKPILSTPCKSINYYLCPDCGEILRINRPFCSKCGSAIDWSDTP